ncbi:MAG TPA: TonB-dependent receptor [Steroidobacteraceae bacterium]|nr:TonB-dependent receptor [Steroidobacteraceae bacterium]
MFKPSFSSSSTKRSVQLAAAISAALLSSQVQAQTEPGNSVALEEVVVTGSLIKGTPEDSAMSVEVISYEDLQNIGRPSNLDLVKTMTESGQTAGEANRYNAFPIGAATVNLRNLGPRFTTVVFNGRRFPEQFSTATGRFNNIAWIPNAAIGSVEVLKIGGSVTYGADAVGGVVNYITRKNFEGLELNADYRYIEDSDGDYNADVIWGKKTDGGNLLVTVGYQHRSQLRSWDRDWASNPYLLNNDTQAWGAANNPGTVLFQTRASGAAGAGVPSATYTTINRPTVPNGLGGTVNAFTGQRQMGAVGTVRDPNCTALGGYAGFGNAPLTNPLCYMQQSQFENLVERQDSYQFYAELNHVFTDSLKYHGEVVGYYLDLPDIAMHPSDSPLSAPLDATGINSQSVSGVGAYYMDGANPGIAPFLNQFTNGYTAEQIGAITGSNPAFANNRGRAALLNGSWRAFASGGNPLFGLHDPQQNTTKLARTTQELSGDLPEFLGTSFEWTAGISYSYVKDRREARDMLVNTLQAALNGFGGPNCNGLQAGTAGSTCEWLNPLSSGVAQNFYTGAPNPGYVPSTVNGSGLVRSLYTDIWLQRVYTLTTVDALMAGGTGLNLPGGEVQVALGAQVRYGTERMTLDDLSNRGLNPCPTPGVTNCAPAARTGVFAFARPNTVLGGESESYMPSDRRFPAQAIFAEAKLPIVDSLEVGLAGRYERFDSDLTDRNNTVFVPAASIRWQALDPIAFRLSVGKTFTQVNPPRDDGATVGASAANTTYGLSAGAFDQFNYDNLDVEPMTSRYLNFGMVIDVGNFRSTIDYYNIVVQDYTRTLTAANILQAIVVPGTSGAGTLVDCSSPLLQGSQPLVGRPYVTFPSACTGQPLLSAMITPVGGVRPRIDYLGGTNQVNAGELRTSGIDLVASYTFDNVLGGDLQPSIDATYITKWELGAFILNGAFIAPGYDGVGFRNTTANGRIGQGVPEWKAGFALNYHRDRHNLNISTRYLPSVIEDNNALFLATANSSNANIGDATGTTVCVLNGPTQNSPPIPDGAGTGQNGAFCPNQNTAISTGRKVEALLNVDLTYRIEFDEGFSTSLTINNVLDEDPSFARTSINYDSGFGSPLGRTFRLAATKRF